ncbi:MAG: hypothetical protein IJ467_03075 [Bacteroidaceae bacterium]|nr:hypothetical protein [Bacteroidaceae bacterium]
MLKIEFPTENKLKNPIFILPPSPKSPGPNPPGPRTKRSRLQDSRQNLQDLAEILPNLFTSDRKSVICFCRVKKEGKNQFFTQAFISAVAKQAVFSPAEPQSCLKVSPNTPQTALQPFS